MQRPAHKRFRHHSGTHYNPAMPASDKGRAAQSRSKPNGVGGMAFGGRRMVRGNH